MSTRLGERLIVARKQHAKNTLSQNGTMHMLSNICAWSILAMYLSNMYAHIIWAICMLTFEHCVCSHLSNIHVYALFGQCVCSHLSNMHTHIWAICILTFKQYRCSLWAIYLHAFIWAMNMLLLEQYDIICMLSFGQCTCSHLSNVHALIWAICVL